MEYLEAMELICYAASDILKAGKRAQIPKDRLSELTSTLLKIHLKLGKRADMSDVLIILNDLLKAIKSVNSMNIKVLTEDMRNSLLNGVLQLKNTIAHVCFTHFSKEPFEDSPEIVAIMREVVSEVIGGGDK